MAKFWALRDKKTGEYLDSGGRPGGVPLLIEVVTDKNKAPEIPPMTIPGSERVHVTLRAVRFPDRNACVRCGQPKPCPNHNKGL